jgi:hypothetical protein
MLAVLRRLNPECDHRRGDMRAGRLGRAFDAAFVHDAVDRGEAVELAGGVVLSERLDEMLCRGEDLVGGGHGAGFPAARADSSS